MITVKIEDVLSSKGRIRVLKTILKYGAVNVNTIVRETGLSHKLVSKYINELHNAGLVWERRYGRLRIIEARQDDPRIIMLKMLLSEDSRGV